MDRNAEPRAGNLGGAERRLLSEPPESEPPASEPLHERVSGIVASPPDPGRRLAGLLRSHFREVWRTVRRFGVPEHAADDATQEVFIIAARRLDDISPGYERKFLFGTAVRVAANLRRMLAARREQADATLVEHRVDPHPSAEVMLDQKRLRELLDAVLDRMPEDLRVTFVLFELEGLSSPEIAEIVGIPVGTVASRLRRARDAFNLETARIRAIYEAEESA